MKGNDASLLQIILASSTHFDAALFASEILK